MSSFERISAETAKSKIDEGNVTLIDIRDEQIYENSHINNALHIDNHTIGDFIAEADKKNPLLVCCYHGNSSQSAAQFFTEQAFEEVYSLDGGFEGWKLLYPDSCT